MTKYLSIKKVALLTLMMGIIGFSLFLFGEAFFTWNYRSTNKNLSSTSLNTKGLKELNASGSGSIHFWDLKRKLTDIKDPVVIIDGMNSDHGYIKGIPTTFLAYQRYAPHWKYYLRRLALTGTTEVKPEIVTPESEMARHYGFLYYPVNIGSKYIESPHAIDNIVQILDHLPPKAWVHFHCHYGKGRTSMMMVMYDILKNAPQVSLEDIVLRQAALGSENLLDTSKWARGSYTTQQLEDRTTFICSFYDYISQRKSGGIQSWSEWKLQVKPIQ